MAEVEGTDEFAAWFGALTEAEQDSVAMVVDLLETRGVRLGHPYSSQVKGARKHKHMRELRIQHGGHPLRVLYAFDPRRVAILLIGGDKKGDEKRFYEVIVPKAEAIYDAYLEELQNEGRTG